MRYSIPVLVGGATGYLLAQNDFKSSIFFGLVTCVEIYENVREDLSKSKKSLNKLELLS
jgi:hypothetical protein